MFPWSRQGRLLLLFLGFPTTMLVLKAYENKHPHTHSHTHVHRKKYPSTARRTSSFSPLGFQETGEGGRNAVGKAQDGPREEPEWCPVSALRAYSGLCKQGQPVPHTPLPPSSAAALPPCLIVPLNEADELTFKPDISLGPNQLLSPRPIQGASAD